MYKKTKTLMLSLIMILSITCSDVAVARTSNSTINQKIATVTPTIEIVQAPKPVVKLVVKPTVSNAPVKKKNVDEHKSKFSDQDIDLIALVTMAEAEGEPELGKRLVIDTVLKRIDKSTYSSHVVHDVIYAPGQFTSMHTSRVKRCYVKSDIVKLVREELEERTNYEVYYFTAGQYGKYGRHLFCVGNHYFSAYE